MGMIKFNNHEQMKMSGFNKTIRMEGEAIKTTISMTIPGTDENEVVLTDLMENSVTDYIVYNEAGESLYEKHGIEGKITSINQNYYNDKLNFEVHLVC